jgi:hypothetical protein
LAINPASLKHPFQAEYGPLAEGALKSGLDFVIGENRGGDG